MIRCENWKWPETLVLIVHGYQTPQFENFVIPLTWLSYPTTSKHSYPCYGFLTSQFQNLPNPSHRIFLDWGSHFCIFSEISRNYMSIKIYIVNNITVLVWHNIFSLDFYVYEPWCQQEGSSKCLSPIPPPTRFSQGFFCFLPINVLSTLFCCDQVLILLFCLNVSLQCFFTVLP